MSHAKSDPFDARVLATFLRTDQGHLTALQPSSEAAQELKLLTRDYQRLVRQQARLRNQLIATLKAYYPRPLELFPDINTPTARAFLRRFPTPADVTALSRPVWRRWARTQHVKRSQELWERLQVTQVPVPPRMWCARRPGCSRCCSPSWRPPWRQWRITGRRWRIFLGLSGFPNAILGPFGVFRG